MSASVNTVDDYLAALPAKERAVLEELRRVIKSAAPQAEEVISYRIPLYKHHGPYQVEHTTIRFSVEKPLPAALVKKIVKSRIAENEAGAAP